MVRAIITGCLSILSACRAAPEPELDPGLEQAMALVASRCAVQEEEGVVQCTGLEMGEVGAGLVKGGQPLPGKLHTLAASLQHQDAKRRVIAANLMGSTYGQGFGDKAEPGVVSIKTAELLLQALKNLPEPLAVRVAPVAAHAAMLSGKRDALYVALLGLKSRPVVLEVYRAVMTHGRLAAFPKVHEVAKTNDPELVSVALGSAGRMRNWSVQEQAKLCPWVANFLKYPDNSVTQQASNLLQACQAPEYQALSKKPAAERSGSRR